MQRSYAEFQKFAEQAQVTSPQSESTPFVADAAIISALPLPTSSATTDEEDDRLVRIALQRWFTRICEDPVMMRDEELRKFVEEDFGVSNVVNTADIVLADSPAYCSSTHLGGGAECAIRGAEQSRQAGASRRR